MSCAKIGDVLLEQSNLPEALQMYQRSLAIIEQLAKSDPGNADLRRDLSLLYAKIGEVLKAQGNLPEALKSYRASLAMIEQLAKSDAGNALWQHDLSVTHKRIGDLLEDQGSYAEALKSYQASLVIADRLAKSDPSNVVWRHDLAFDLGYTSFVLLVTGDASGALAAADRSLSILPDEPWLYLNCAHALMFLDRAEEARAIYMKYRGRLRVVASASWEQVVLADFADLRTAGLAKPLMADIEKEFSKSN